LYDSYSNGNTKDVMVFTSKDPVWNKKSQCFVLDFKGKVTKTSVKNFILTEKRTSKEPIVFGKIANNLYSLTVGYPFSVFQGFALGISSMDFKIGCQ
jgi:hypothetical protein